MIWYECCGRSLAVALRLVGGPHANPPISSMGSKRGYARAILGVLGLREGQGCDEVWMADPSEWGAVWPALASPRAAEVAAILRSWKDREPRELWEECRAKGWGELKTAGEVASWAWFTGHSDSSKPPRLAAPCANPDGNADGSWKAPPRDWLASHVEAVARWLACGQYAYRTGEPESGFCPAKTLPQPVTKTCHGSGPLTLQAVIENIQPRGWPVTLRCHHGSCLDVPVPQDARGFVVYFDGSYKHPDGTPTTGYTENIYAEDAREYLLAWSTAGAVVAVSDARPLDQLFPGWKTLRIDTERMGQKRTFSKQSAEWLTLNREPAWRPSIQIGLFG